MSWMRETTCDLLILTQNYENSLQFGVGKLKTIKKTIEQKNCHKTHFFKNTKNLGNSEPFFYNNSWTIVYLDQIELLVFFRNNLKIICVCAIEGKILYWFLWISTISIYWGCQYRNIDISFIWKMDSKFSNRFDIYFDMMMSV